MRKSKKSLIAILFVALLSCHLFAVDGVVTFVKGKVEVKKGDDWVALNVWDTIKQSEMINTGFQSEAKIKLMESILYLGPVTRVTLDKLASNSSTDKVNVYLTTGSVRSKVNRTETKRVSYTVRTPIAVASVRGTDFSIDGPGNVNVKEGKVIVLPAKKLEKSKNQDADDEDDEEDDDDDKDDEKAEEGKPSKSKNDESEDIDDNDDTDDVDDVDDDVDDSKANEETPSKSDNEESKTDASGALSEEAQQALDEIMDTENLDNLEGSEVGANQSMKVHNSSTAGEVKHNIEKKAEKIMNAVTTESTKPAIDAPTPQSNNNINNITKPTSGSISVNINKPPFGSLDVTIQLQK